MTNRHKKALTSLAVVLAFAFTQVGVLAGLPSPAPGSPQRAITAKLTTKNNAPITVNGNSTGTGSTILTGATIETPDQVSATIDLGDAGVVELQPGSKVQLDFDANGNVHVKVLKGCAVAKRKTNVLPDANTEIYTDSASEKTSKTRSHMGFCLAPTGGLAALGAGVGGGLTGGAIAGVAAAAGGGATALYFGLRNTSPSR
jgi:hypothetical protein